MNILELYEKIKNIKGVDIALLDSYLKVILKDADCESVEELFQKISECNDDLNKNQESSNTLRANLDSIMESKKNIQIDKNLIKYLVSWKSLFVLFLVFTVMALAATGIAINFSLLSVVVGIASVGLSGFVFIKINNKIMQPYYDLVEKSDKLDEEEKSINLEYNQVIEDLLSLNEQRSLLNKVNDEASTFINTYLNNMVVTNYDNQPVETIEEVDTRIYDMHLQL